MAEEFCFFLAFFACFILRLTSGKEDFSSECNAAKIKSIKRVFLASSFPPSPAILSSQLSTDQLDRYLYFLCC